MEQQQDNKKVLISGIIAVAILVLLVGGVMVAKSKEDSKQAASTKLATAAQQNGSTTDATSGAAPSDGDTTTTAGTTYKNGTYTASGTYNTPESVESISVTVTLKDDVVSEVSATTDPQSSESREYQQDFLSGYKSLVVGKKIDSISLSRVSGSSLTSRGFNNAIRQIESDAKV